VVEFAVDERSVKRSPKLTNATLIELFIRLRWRLLRGALRHGGPQRVAVIIGLVAGTLFGFGAGVLLALLAQTIDDPAPLLIVTPAALVASTVALGIIAGVTQPVDPRVIASEPLTDRQLALGLLTTTACGPPGIAAIFVGCGLYLGALRGVTSVLPALLALLSLLATLLLVSRATVNALGLLTNRSPRIGQVLIGLVSLCFYGSFQLITTAFAELSDERRREIARIVRFTPPGQLGAAFATSGESAVKSLGHVAVGSLWLPLLGWLFVSSTRRLIVGTPSVSTQTTSGPRSRLSRLARRVCGSGPIGAIAWRSVRTRLRHPRTALETFVGAGVGMAIVLVPALTRDAPGASAVLVGGAVQLAVLFMAGNSIGSDGIALGSEILCGLEPEVVVEAKARSVLVVAAPLAVIGPMLAAAITGEWRFLPAGIFVGIGGLFAGAGGAIVQSTLVPIAVPESDNPLAGGDSGQGLMAALMLGAVIVSLSIATLPIALALVWALDRESVVFVSLFGAATMGAGWCVLRLSIRAAARRWRSREPEIFEAIVPAR
jgi:ABC-2 type transport system permease protein